MRGLREGWLEELVAPAGMKSISWDHTPRGSPGRGPQRLYCAGAARAGLDSRRLSGELRKLKVIAAVVAGADHKLAILHQLKGIGIEVAAGDATGPVTEGLDIINLLEVSDEILAAATDAMKVMAIHEVALADHEVRLWPAMRQVEIERRHSAAV